MKRCKAGGTELLDALDQLVGKRQRLAAEASVGAVLHPSPLPKVREFLASDAEQPAACSPQPAIESPRRRECRREDLGGQVRRNIRATSRAIHEGEHVRLEPVIERPKRFRVLDRADQELLVGGTGVARLQHHERLFRARGML